MERICSVSELNSLVLPYFKRGVITNCFLGAKEFETFINENSLFYEKNENVLMLFRKVNEFFRIYFYINEFDEIKIPKNSVVEVVEPNKNLIDYFVKLGFRFEKDRLEMELKSLDGKCEKLIKPNDIELKTAYEIVVNNFDTCYGCIPSFEEFCEEDVLISKEENSCVDGVIHYKTLPKYSKILHIAVLEEKRLKGVGKKLLTGYIAKEKGKCKSFRLWVNSENEIAKRFYLKNGYDFTGRIAKIFSNVGED